MSSLIGGLRRAALAPSLAEVGFARRGFAVSPTPATARLEAIPQSVVVGFEWGLDSPGLADLERRLAMVEPDLRGFAYEGATMAAVVVDAMSGFRGTRTRDLLAGPGRPHLFLAYIGVGFAMARLPRPLWRKVLPDLDGVPYHPTMSWLAVDGYAFDRAYFDTRTWVGAQYVPPAYPWQGRPDYFPRAVDHGVGRALWFIHGGGVHEVAEAVDRFPARRQADLWAGVGLAAAFAGGADATDLATLRRAAGPHWRQLALGSVFAATARTHSGVGVPPHTGVATLAFAGLGVGEAAELARATTVTEADAVGGEPAYERWRAAIRAGIAEPWLRAAG
jgi:enediyne biosynthesis protein E2